MPEKLQMMDHPAKAGRKNSAAVWLNVILLNEKSCKTHCLPRNILL